MPRHLKLLSRMYNYNVRSSTAKVSYSQYCRVRILKSLPTVINLGKLTTAESTYSVVQVFIFPMVFIDDSISITVKLK